MATPTKTSSDTPSRTSSATMSYPEITSLTLSELMLLCVEDVEWEHSLKSPYGQEKYVFPLLRAHMDKLRLDVGESTFECFLQRMRRFEYFYRLTSAPPNDTEPSCPNFSPESSTNTAPLVAMWSFTFNEAEFVHAGHMFEQEMYNHRCIGIVPTYDPHPAYDRFKAMMHEIDSKQLRVVCYFKDICKNIKHKDHPWDGDADADKYYCFVHMLEALDIKTWGDEDSPITSNPDTGIAQENASCSGTGNGSFSLSLQSYDSAQMSMDLGDGGSLIAAGEALDAEMLAHNCTEPTPDYTPHPAYDLIHSKWNLMMQLDLSPLQFIVDELGKEGALQWLSLDVTLRVLKHLNHIEDQKYLDCFKHL